MAKLSKSEVKYIAHLSKLALTERELMIFSEQLSSVLGYVEKLGKQKTTEIKSVGNITGLTNILRADEIDSSDISHSEIAKNAPEFENDYFIVPGVFES